MEINYKLILKYLDPNKNILSQNIPEIFVDNDNDIIQNIKEVSNKSIFITHKNLYTYSYNFPLKFKNIFSDKFYRLGITVNDNNNNNISFWSSLLSLIDIDKKFIIPYDNDEITVINNFKNDLVNKYLKKNISSNLKKYDKNDIKENMNLIPNFIIIQYLVNIIKINIFIFNFKTESINIIYDENSMNPFKDTILLANYDIFWEPIILNKKGEDQKRFSYTDSIIKKILLNNEIKYYEEENLNKKFKYTNPKDIIIEEENKLININTTNTTNNDNIFISITNDSDKISNNMDYKKLNKTKLIRMKLDELLILSKKLEININNETRKKSITKSELIELILLSINNCD